MIFKHSVLNLKENTARLHYIGQLVDDVWEIIAVYSENHTKHINTLCGKTSELPTVKTVGISRTGDRGQGIEKNGRVPLRRRRSALDCRAC
jgi:hypothetical protein